MGYLRFLDGILIESLLCIARTQLPTVAHLDFGRGYHQVANHASTSCILLDENTPCHILPLLVRVSESLSFRTFPPSDRGPTAERGSSQKFCSRLHRAHSLLISEKRGRLYAYRQLSSGAGPLCGLNYTFVSTVTTPRSAARLTL